MQNNEQEPGQQFVLLYNQMDHWLREFTGSEHGSFFNRIDRAARKHGLIRRHSDELKDFGELRNAIIHHERYPEVIIANPHPDVLARFRRIVESVKNPERLIPAFERRVSIFGLATPLSQALAYIAKSGFSQTPVVEEGLLGLLTNDSIARWLASQVAADCLDLATAKVADLLPFEPEGSFLLMSRYQTVDEARGAFEQNRVLHKPRLHCILITENGKPDEKLLGIITPYDLVEQD